MVFDSPEQLRQGIQAFQQELAARGMEVVFDDKWAVEDRSGYVAVHAKFKLTNPDGHDVIGELQFHLSDIFSSGAIHDIKERSHTLYEKAREGGITPDMAAAMHYLFTVGAAHSVAKNRLQPLVEELPA